MKSLNLNFYLSQEDPVMLPVPNHVALNHLYALSIKVIYNSFQYLFMSKFLIRLSYCTLLMKYHIDTTEICIALIPFSVRRFRWLL